MQSLEVKANAKINLALAIKNKRSDGYHNLDLIYQEIDLSDTLIIKQSPHITFSTDSDVLQNEGDNLCVRAARLLQQKFKIPGLEIFLKKRIPIGAGLGGGSSDAAAVLKGGAQLYQLKISTDQLASLGAVLGADVPFFLFGGTAYGRGIGNILKKIPLYSQYSILLVLPQIKISTVWAYKNLNLGLTRKNTDDKFRGFRFHNLELKDFRSEFFNDFEKLVFANHPQLKMIKALLYQEGALFAALSGSGSSVFGLFPTKSAIEKAQRILSKKYKTQRARPVNTN